LGLVVLAVCAIATVPHLINYQGVLTDSGGIPISGTHDLTFAIYPDSALSATAYWTETHTGVQFDNGLFHVILGGTTPIPDDLFAEEVRWIGIAVDTEPEMKPRLQITSVPWAFHAAVADTVLFGGGGVGDGHSLDAADGDPVDVVYVDDDGHVGIGTTSPNAPLHVASGSTVLLGADTLGAGTKLMWLPAKSAFRAGYVMGSEWDWANVGDYSTAMGYRTTASGDYSTAMGVITTASGAHTTAMGWNTTASGDYSTAMGQGTTASDLYSTAMGDGATASGSRSTAMGFATTASGSRSTAMGYQTKAESYNSMAIGRYNVGGGNPSSWVDTDPLFEIGNGNFGTPANAMTVLKNGNVGLGAITPAYKLDVADTVQMSGFKMPPGASNGYVLTSDGTGVGSWQAPSLMSDSDWQISGNDMYSNVSGNVGIGTTSPSVKLDVSGDINTDSNYDIGGNAVLSVSGTENTFVGVNAGANNTGNSGTFVGFNAGFNNEGSSNTFVGRNTGYYNTTGNFNTFVGYNTGRSNTIGRNNTFLGHYAGYSNTTAENNTFVGYAAGNANSTGYWNTFLGKSAGYSNTTGYANTFLGEDAGNSNITGFFNTFVGRGAGYSNTTGTANTFVGLEAGRSNTTGSSNTFLGITAGYANTTGSNNVFIGKGAGYSETGSNKLYIANGSASSNVLIYGDFSTDRIGISTVSPGYTLDVAGPCHASSFPTSSDERLKKNVEPLSDVLEKLERIRGVSFEWNELYESLGRSTGHKEIGVIAQEVEAVFPELVTSWGDESYKAVDYGRLAGVLIEAIKAQQEQIEELKGEIEKLKSEVKDR
jgi:hypothetical protein